MIEGAILLVLLVPLVIGGLAGFYFGRLSCRWHE